MLRFKCPHCSQRTISMSEKFWASYKQKQGCPQCHKTWSVSATISFLIIFFSVMSSQVFFSFTDFSFLVRCFVGGSIILALILVQPVIKK